MFLHSSKRRTVHRSCARQIVKGKVTITIGGTPDFSVVQKRIMPQDHKVAYFTTLTAGTKKERLLDLASGSCLEVSCFLFGEPRLRLPRTAG